MELSILETIGLPEGSILSVRSGPIRRQSPLPCVEPFKLPAGPWPLRIDVLALLGKSDYSATLAKLDADGRVKVPLESRDRRKMSVTLQVFDGKAGSKPDKEVTPNRQPLRRRDTEAEARAYLDRHRLHEFMHALFELLLREQPDDPYSFIAARFQEAAQLEPQNVPIEIPAIDKHEKIARSLVSTAPTMSPTVKSDEAVPNAPDGAVQLVVRSLRGRSLARLAIHPDEKVSAVKERLAASLGVPVASQQLLWWAETLPNDTTLEDHSMPASGASVHLAYGTRDPRLKLALSGSSDGGLRLWNMCDGAMVRDFDDGGSSAVLSMAVHWETMRAFTGSFNGRVCLWDLNSGKTIKQFDGHKEEVNVVQVDWEGMRALSGASDASAKLWNLSAEGGKCVRTLDAGSTVYSLAVDWSKMKAYAGLRSGVVRCWDLETGTKLQDLNGGVTAAQTSHSTVSAAAIDCLGNRAVSGLEDGHLVYWHFGKVQEGSASSSSDNVAEKPTPKTKVLLAHYCAIRAIAATWKPEGSQALCGSDDGSLSLWRVDSQECLARFARHMGYVWTLYADWSRGRALSGAFDGCFKLWDLRNGECLRTVQSHCRPVRSICGGS